MHDPRIGRFFAIDPLTAKYPYYSPYAFSGNRVIDAFELEGLEPVVNNKNEVTGYKVQEGQGVTQIVDDLNNPETQKKYGYYLLKPITFEQVVNWSGNEKYFKEKDNNNNGPGFLNDKNDPEHCRLNMNTNDVLDLSFIDYTFDLPGALAIDFNQEIHELNPNHPPIFEGQDFEEGMPVIHSDKYNTFVVDAKTLKYTNIHSSKLRSEHESLVRQKVKGPMFYDNSPQIPMYRFLIIFGEVSGPAPWTPNTLKRAADRAEDLRWSILRRQRIQKYTNSGLILKDKSTE